MEAPGRDPASPDPVPEHSGVRYGGPRGGDRRAAPATTRTGS